MGIFGGAYLRDRRLVLLIPLVTMFLSDVFLGFHGMIIWVYGSLLVISYIAILLNNRTNFLNCTFAVLGGSLCFFLITNFGVWFMSGFYEKSISGLFTCYIMALPFFQNTLAGSIIYGAIMFGVYEGLKHYLPDMLIDSIQK